MGREGRVSQPNNMFAACCAGASQLTQNKAFSSCSAEAANRLASTRDESKTSEQDILYGVKIKIHFLTASNFTNTAANHGLRDPQHH